MPVWFCQNGNQKSKIECFAVSIEKPKNCDNCGATEFKQSEDVLDTWFSSALWPFATLGWPEKTSDLKKYYPTSLLSTARDIIYLWVARMVFSSLEFLKKIPFDKVYIHATILTLQGRRMSKSLGTGVDPLELINKYGADATRLGLLYQTNRDQQAIRFDERTILAARNFVNKLWNISRFAQMQKRDANLRMHTNDMNIKPKTLADEWILSRLNSVIDSVTKKIKNYELGEATKELYEFTWHEFADWYLEISKLQITDENLKNNTVYSLQFIVYSLLKLLHPFIPFVTEKINIQFNNLTPKQFNELLLVAPWPRAKKILINQKAEKKFEKVKNLTTEIRKWRKENKISSRQIIPLPNSFSSQFQALPIESKEIIKKLTKIK